jgi:hypothetical protein
VKKGLTIENLKKIMDWDSPQISVLQQSSRSAEAGVSTDFTADAVLAALIAFLWLFAVFSTLLSCDLISFIAFLGRCR